MCLDQFKVADFKYDLNFTISSITYDYDKQAVSVFADLCDRIILITSVHSPKIFRRVYKSRDVQKYQERLL